MRTFINGLCLRLATIFGKPHKGVYLTHSSAGKIWVDEGLARVISLCWEAGIETHTSCEKHNDVYMPFDNTRTWYKHLVRGYAYVWFPTIDAANRFMKIMRGETYFSGGHSLRFISEAPTTAYTIHSWHIGFVPFDSLEAPVISFPPKDISWIEERLTSHLQQRQ
jgi:hypothetical protein